MSFEFLDSVYYGNTVRDFATAAVLALAVIVVIGIAQRISRPHLVRLAQKSATRIDDIAVALLGATRWWSILAAGLFAGSLSLAITEEAETTVRTAAVVVLLLQIGIWASAGLKSLVRDIHDEKLEKGDAAGLGAIQMMSLIARMAAWVVVALLILANVGVNVGAVIAGLGIGGIAVALALQNILSDLFASISIVLDKPFEIGDFLSLGDDKGTVENIGLKTTRLRSLSGEQLIFSNSDMLKSRIRNYKRMQERRAVFTFGVTYQTPPEALEALSGRLREIIESVERTRFDRAHFQSFGDSALIFEAVYFMLVPGYNDFMDAQQLINLEILRSLEAAGIDIAYPTQTLYVRQFAA